MCARPAGKKSASADSRRLSHHVRTTGGPAEEGCRVRGAWVPGQHSPPPLRVSPTSTGNFNGRCFFDEEMPLSDQVWSF
jgi:hypothetical protein